MRMSISSVLSKIAACCSTQQDEDATIQCRINVIFVIAVFLFATWDVTYVFTGNNQPPTLFP